MPPLLAAALLTLPQLTAVPQPPDSAGQATEGVTVFLLNEGAEPVTAPPPARVDAVARDGAALALEPDDAAPVAVAAGGFVRVRYRLAEQVVATPIRGTPAARTAAHETEVATALGTRSGFLDRFAPHAPIYGVFGTGDDGAKLQLSLAFRPFDTGGALDGVRVAWTSTFFWDIQEPSGPFRTTTYSPEVFYTAALDAATQVSLGYRHDSNGLGAGGSIDVNRLTARVVRAADLGGGWRLEVAPEAWAYVGTDGGAPGIGRFWGHGAIAATLLQTDGVKLALRTRGALETARGATELFASYPLAPIGGGTGLYLFAQAFAGYGEAVGEYDRRSRAVRVGLGFTR